MATFLDSIYLLFFFFFIWGLFGPVKWTKNTKVEKFDPKMPFCVQLPICWFSTLKPFSCYQNCSNIVMCQRKTATLLKQLFLPGFTWLEIQETQCCILIVACFFSAQLHAYSCTSPKRPIQPWPQLIQLHHPGCQYKWNRYLYIGTKHETAVPKQSIFICWWKMPKCIQKIAN